MGMAAILDKSPGRFEQIDDFHFFPTQKPKRPNLTLV